MNLVALFLLCIALCGCSSSSEKIMVDNISSDIAEDVMADTSTKNEFLYGADITEDSLAKGITEFEGMTGKHDIYADEIYITETQKAENFILECYASGKTPYIILKSQSNIGKDNMEESIDNMADVLGKYQVPIFVEIFENDYVSDSRNEYYEYAAQKFFDKNAYVKRVWSIKADDIMVADKYCPDSNVDYICVNGYFDNIKQAERFFTEKKDHYELDKPIILRFGAVSFSSEGCTYTSDDACSTINKVYVDSKEDPDITSVIYMDKSNRISNKSPYANYYITIDRKITDAYKNSISLS